MEIVSAIIMLSIEHDLERRDRHHQQVSHGPVLAFPLGLNAVWPQLASLAMIGTVLFVISLARFPKTLGVMV